MAAKDTAPYIGACLESVIAQSYPHWELIVINDHSSDRTPEIVEEYAQKDQRIKLVHSHGHRLIPALQSGYPHAQGYLDQSHGFRR